MSGPDSHPGALVISLDFEMRWGARERTPAPTATPPRVEAARALVAELSALFVERGIRATWATVGILFASTRQDVEACRPAVRPAYERRELDPYGEPIGADEAADPERLAGSLVGLLAGRPGQEIGSHTFSHYYCLEAGQDEAAFRADLAAASAIAARRQLDLTSLVLPRNQWNPAYAAAVLDSGFTCIRGPQPAWAHRARRQEDQGRLARAARLADTYGGVAPPPTTPWDAVRRPDGLCDIPASAFLRPPIAGGGPWPSLQLRRLRAGLCDAGRRRRLFHLWWHPHNFLDRPGPSFDLLNRLLDEFDLRARADGMESLSMRDVARRAGAPATGRRAAPSAG